MTHIMYIVLKEKITIVNSIVCFFLQRLIVEVTFSEYSCAFSTKGHI